MTRLSNGSKYILLLLIAFCGACRKKNAEESQVSGPAKVKVVSHSLHGDYYTDSTFSSNNYYILNIDVIQPGKYYFHTEDSYGVMFSDSGTLHNKGMTTVTLRPQGRFVKPGNFHFLTFIDSTLTAGDLVLVVVNENIRPDDNAGLEALGSEPNGWVFTADGTSYKGTFTTGVFNAFDVSPAKYQFKGTSFSSVDTAIILNVQTNGWRPEVGTYYSDADSSKFEFSKGNKPQSIYYTYAKEQKNVLTYKVLSYDVLTNTVTCTFRGYVNTADGKTAAVTRGAFRYTNLPFYNGQ